MPGLNIIPFGQRRAEVRNEITHLALGWVSKDGNGIPGIFIRKFRLV